MVVQAAEKTSKIVKVKGKDKWYVQSEPGKKFNSYDGAKKRLNQIEMFRHMKGKKKGKKRKSSEPLDLFNGYLVACGTSCPVCGGPMQYDDGSDAYACGCGHVGPNAPATVIAGADIYERFDELNRAVVQAEDDESEEAAHLRELDELLRKRDETLDAVKENDKEKKDASIAASKRKLDGVLKQAAASNPRLASIIGILENSMASNKIAENLRTIAHRIDGSRNPSRAMVAQDIRRIIAALEHNAAVPGMDWLDDTALLKLSEELVSALKSESAGKLESVIPKMIEQLKNFEFRAKAERQKKQLQPGKPAV